MREKSSKTPEEKQSTESVEGGEVSAETLDTVFRERVRNFFSKQEAYATDQANHALNNTDKGEYERMIDKYRLYAEDLDQLSYSGRKKEVIQENPHLVGEALGKLAGFMSSTNLYVEGAVGDEEIDGKTQELHESSKRVFMESCAKTFPDARIPSLGNIDSMVLQIRTTADALHSPHLENIKIDLVTLENAKLQYQGNPKELAIIVDQATVAMGKKMELVTETSKELSQEVEEELATVARMVYELQALRDSLQEKIYGRSDVKFTESQVIDAMEIAITEKPVDSGEPEIKESSGNLSLDQVDSMFNNQSIKTIDDIRAVVSPEAIVVIKNYVLEHIDARVEQGKRIAKSNPDTIIEASRVSHVMGFSASGDRKLQFPASVAEGRIVSGKDVAFMSIADYLNRYLKYDLAQDSERIEDIRRYTNIL